LLSERFQAAANFLKIEAVTRQILYDLKTDEIMKRIQALRATPIGQLRRRPDEILLVPILQLAQTYADNPARRFTVVSVHGNLQDENKTVFMKVDCHLGIVNKVERSRLGYFGLQAERKGVRSPLSLFLGVLCIEGQ
jgi:hypothetical protein